MIYEKLLEHPQQLEEINDIEQLVEELRECITDRPIDRNKYHVLRTNLSFFADEYITILLKHIENLESEMSGYAG